MANEALQNQALLDQMFARSLAPINQALEVQRQRVQQQRDWERNMAQRERELMMEQTFRGQQQRETLAAQRAAAEAQQKAIGEREIAAEGRAEGRTRIQRINANPLATPEEKARAKANPEYAAELDAQLANREVEDNVKSLDAYAKQANAAMKEALYAMATESKTIPPDVLKNAGEAWLITQDDDIKRALAPIILKGGTLTPAAVDAALKEARGMFGWGVNGLNDDKIMTAALAYRAALAGVGGSKEPGPGVQAALAKYRTAQERVQGIVKSPSGQIAANQFVQREQAKNDTEVAEYAKLQESTMAQRVKDTPLEPADAFSTLRSQPASQATQPGGDFVTAPVVDDRPWRLRPVGGFQTEDGTPYLTNQAASVLSGGIYPVTEGIKAGSRDIPTGPESSLYGFVPKWFR